MQGKLFVQELGQELVSGYLPSTIIDRELKGTKKGNCIQASQMAFVENRDLCLVSFQKLLWPKYLRKHVKNKIIFGS